MTMTPGRNLSQSSSQNKKQQSISNFFTSKPSPTPEPKVPATLPNHAADDSLSVLTNEEAQELPNRVSNHLKRTKNGEHSDYENEGSEPKKRRKSAQDDDGAPAASDEEQSIKERKGFKDLRGSGITASRQANTSSIDRSSDRTRKYLLSSPPEPEPDKERRQHHELMHERFVRKLGRPDSIADIKRRNHLIAEETVDGEDGGEEEDEEEQQDPKPTRGKRAAGGKKPGKLTPAVQQYLDIKRKYLDTLLVVEVGYKYQIYGEDARIAAKELGVVCIPGKFRYDEHPSEAHLNRFASCSFPTHRLNVRVKQLVQNGHKVGIVRQLETAALKAAGSNRYAPFERRVTNLYTKATYVDDVEGLDAPADAPDGTAPSTGYLLCLTESNAKGWGNDEKVHVGMVAVQPYTGDVIYDDFEDGFMRSEIETRLLHMAPSEFLVVGDLSRASEKLVQHLVGSRSNVFGDQARLERVSKAKTIAAESYSHVSNFYAGKMDVTNGANGSHVLDKVHSLSEQTTICLSALIKHMSEYGLEHIFDLTRNFQPFSARSYMLINGNTLTSLEIYQNQTDHGPKGSLFWALDRTCTPFGKRLLRKWVGRPLLDKAKLQERIQAVEELKEGERTRNVEKITHLLRHMKSDLERVLTRIYYQKSTRPELLNFLQTLQRLSCEYAHVTEPNKAGFDSDLLNQAIASLPKVSEQIVSFLERINMQAAKSDDKYAFFREEHETDDISTHKLGIASVEDDLDNHRAKAAEKIKKKKVEYVTVSGIEYLIEIDNNGPSLRDVPASWAKMNGTKKVARFHTPEVVKLVRERDRHKEALAAACDKAFVDLLAEIGTYYQEFRDAVQNLAILDCLLSLADVAGQPGYVKPAYTTDTRINITAGRHPMVEQLIRDAYIPNDAHLDAGLSASDPRALLVTGPNMGGKSSYVRQIALISIMGQIGSYVPAEAAELGMLDAVFTRMGAGDNIMAGESTFMVELSETSDILKQATNRSLVLLDELGRGTSTHDGVAIAEAVLRAMVERGCMCLFVTHYQSLARLEKVCDGLKNVHVTFVEDEGGKGVTFLYEVGEGVAHRSYG